MFYMLKYPQGMTMLYNKKKDLLSVLLKYLRNSCHYFALLFTFM